MASRIQPKQASAATTGVACLVGTVAWILISSIYVGNSAGWPQFVLSAFAAVTVCTVAASALVYAAHQQYVAKKSLFSDPCADEFEYRSTGQWAVVTGATDGIGKEYARQLAIDHGMDVLLVGRNPDKLRAVARLIRKESAGRRRVMTVVADFAEDPVSRNETVDDVGQRDETVDDVGQRDETVDDVGQRNETVDDVGQWDGDQEDDVGERCFCSSDGRRQARRRCPLWYRRLRAVVEGRLHADGGVGVLVNCAGACYPHPEFFAGMTSDGDTATSAGDGPVRFTADYCGNADVAVRCNVAGAVHACRLVLPGMLDRGRGLVINVGSASASVPPAAPLMALYAATKKFLEKLSSDLDAECAYLTRGCYDGLGVRVQCARPAYVATAMLRSANPDVRVVPGNDDGHGEEDEDEDEDDDDDNYGDSCWWASRRKRLEDRFQRWLVPSARRWVRSALHQGGMLYASGPDSGPANYTGYWPHTLLVWCARLASAVTPRRWFVDRVLIPGMLVYRDKGRAAIAAAEERRKTFEVTSGDDGRQVAERVTMTQ